jgi:hypothetical protein
MVEVTRDESWFALYKDAQASGKGEAMCITMANSIWRYRVKAHQMKEARSARAIKKMSEKKRVGSAPRSGQLCRGKTKSGQPCRFKASCDGYCKKHLSM